MPTPKPSPLPVPALIVKPIAVGYNRQSRARPEDIEAGRVVSTNLQNDNNRHFALAHQWDYDEELSNAGTDINVSGGRKERDKRSGKLSWTKRKGLSTLHEAAQQGRFQHLIVYKLSRLGRSAIEVADICESFRRVNVFVHVVDLGLSTSTIMGEMMVKILSAVAEMELETIREWTREASLARARDGKHHGPLPGWVEKDPENPGQYRLRETYAETLLDMVAARLRGLPYSQIARMMNAQNRLTSEGVAWTTALVQFYFSPSYRKRMEGWAFFGRTREHGDPRRILTPNVFPALITPEQADELDAVQRELVLSIGPKNAQGVPVSDLSRGVRNPVQATRYLLTGFCLCGVCGGKLLGHVGGATKTRPGQRSYYCQNVKEKPGAHPDIILDETAGPGRKKGRVNYFYNSADGLEEAVFRAVGHVLLTFGDKLALPPQKTKMGQAGATPKPPAQPKRDLDALLAAEDALTDSFTSALITKAQFARQLERIEKERAAWVEWEKSKYGTQDATLGWAGVAAAMGSAGANEALETAEVKLALRRVVEKVEYPIKFAGVRSLWDSKTDMPWARITFKQALPSGETVVLAAVHQARFTGPRRVWIGDGPPTNQPHRAGIKYPGSAKVRDPKTGRYLDRTKLVA